MPEPAPPPLPTGTLPELRARQDGVLARAQLLALGWTEPDLRRALRRRELTARSPGIYLGHTGPPTPRQREWIVVLALWPAALCHDSVARPGDLGDRPVHVAIDRTRSRLAPPGARLHHLPRLVESAQWNLSPPRVRLEQALVSLAAEARDDLEAIAVLADAVQARRTTAGRLLDALEGRPRVRRRALLRACLADLGAGACSALEQGYLARVERAHRLPTARRQVRESARGTVYRDVEYRAHGVLVELDGRLFHDDARARDRDLERDLDATLDGRVTVRLGWGQVYRRGCSTARTVGSLLQRGGWRGQPARCPSCPPPGSSAYG